MNGVQIRIGDLLYAVVKRWKMIIFLALAGCGFGVAWTAISYIRGDYMNYSVYCSVALTAQADTGNFTNNSPYLSQGDFHLAEDMVDAACYVLTSSRTIQTAYEILGVTASTNEVYNNLSAERYNETQIIEITLRWNDPDSGIQVMNALIEACRQVLPETLMVGSVAVIDGPTAYVSGGGRSSYMGPLMGVLGMLFGAGLAALDLIMRPTLLNLKDVDTVFGLETLGVVPEDSTTFRKNNIILEDEDSAETTARQNFASSAYILRNRLGSKDEKHCFYVTSTMDGEGKSTVAAHLAVELSDMEKHVLLLDLDTKNPSLGGMFLRTTDYNRSLNALYKGEATLDEALISLTGYLDFLPTVLEYNAIPLDSTIFDLIQKLRDNYDYIVIDAPPVGQTSDALSLNRVANAALFVIRYDMATIQDIENALNKLDKSGIRILGCIVNGMQTMRDMLTSGQRLAGRAMGKKRSPASPAMEGDAASINISEEDDLISQARPNKNAEFTLKNYAGKPRNLLDEITDDDFGDFADYTGMRYSDGDALDALYKIGIDGSWKNSPAPEPEAAPQAAEPEESNPEPEAEPAKPAEKEKRHGLFGRRRADKPAKQKKSAAPKSERKPAAEPKAEEKPKAAEPPKPQPEQAKPEPPKAEPAAEPKAEEIKTELAQAAPEPASAISAAEPEQKKPEPMPTPAEPAPEAEEIPALEPTPAAKPETVKADEERKASEPALSPALAQPEHEAVPAEPEPAKTEPEAKETAPAEAADEAKPAAGAPKHARDASAPAQNYEAREEKRAPRYKKGGFSLFGSGKKAKH